MNTTKTIIAAVAVLGSVSFAQATSFDPNLANRYPAYGEAGVYGYTAKGGAPVLFNGQTSIHTRDVSLPRQTLQSRDVSLPRQTETPATEAWIDRASQNFSGGGY
jgi:hypothetical protein